MQQTVTTYIDQVVEELAYRGYETKIHEVQKKNTLQRALSVMTDDSTITPTFYEDSFVEMAKINLSIDQMADIVLDCARQATLEISMITHKLNDHDFIVCGQDANLC